MTTTLITASLAILTAAAVIDALKHRKWLTGALDNLHEQGMKVIKLGDELQDARSEAYTKGVQVRCLAGKLEKANAELAGERKETSLSNRALELAECRIDELNGEVLSLKRKLAARKGADTRRAKQIKVRVAANNGGYAEVKGEAHLVDIWAEANTLPKAKARLEAVLGLKGKIKWENE